MVMWRINSFGECVGAQVERCHKLFFEHFAWVRFYAATFVHISFVALSGTPFIWSVISRSKLLDGLPFPD
jgi:hypothetical protein